MIPILGVKESFSKFINIVCSIHTMLLIIFVNRELALKGHFKYKYTSKRKLHFILMTELYRVSLCVSSGYELAIFQNIIYLTFSLEFN